MALDAQRIIDVIRQVVTQMTRNGAQRDYQYAYATTAGSYQVSAYIAGSAELSPYVDVPAGLYIPASSYVEVVRDDEDIIVTRQMPTLFTKLAYDYVNGRAYIGDGSVEPSSSGVDGQVLKSGGSGVLRWGDTGLGDTSNLAADPSFERTESMWTAQTGFSIGTTNPRTGNRAAAFTGGTGALRNHQLVETHEGDKFFISGWVRGASADGTATVRISWVNYLFVEVGSSLLSGAFSDGTYKYVSGVVTNAVPTAAYARAEFVVLSRTTGTWYFDDIFMSKLIPASLLGVGADDTIPMADSTADTGLKWVASASPSAVGTAAATGTADTFTRGDHVHAHEAAHVAHDTIWAAKGDLVVGTGSDAAAVLTVGANDTIPMADSGQATGIKWVASATPGTAAFGASPSAGSGDTFSRGDHVHGMPIVKHDRGDWAALAAGTNADRTITWGSAFADANYTVVVTLRSASGDAAIRRLTHGITDKTASAVTVRVDNPTASSVTPSYDAVAIHD
jgi:hypothetical protein